MSEFDSFLDRDTRDDYYAATILDIENVRQWQANILQTKNQDEARLHLMEILELINFYW